MSMSVNEFAPADIVFSVGPDVFHGTSGCFVDALMERFTLGFRRVASAVGVHAQEVGENSVRQAPHVLAYESIARKRP